MKWGLVLSGGSAFGIANGGVLEVFEHEGLRPDYIAGSSMGAIIAALTALGYNSATLKDLALSLKMHNIAAFHSRPFAGGLHGGMFRQKLAHHLEKLIGDARIRDTKIPFVCVAGRVKEPVLWRRIMRKGFDEYIVGCIEPYIFPKDTKIMDAILASSAIPVFFSPVKIGGETFVDLCHFGPVPARSLQKTYHPDVIIATNTNPSHKVVKKYLPKSWGKFLDAGYAEIEKSLEVCDLIIEPKMPSQFYRFDKAMSFWHAGVESAEKALPKIRKLL